MPYYLEVFLFNNRVGLPKGEETVLGFKSGGTSL